jgi:hypothetical protein
MADIFHGDRTSSVVKIEKEGGMEEKVNVYSLREETTG